MPFDTGDAIAAENPDFCKLVANVANPRETLDVTNRKDLGFAVILTL
jgi:hypothetical protein